MRGREIRKKAVFVCQLLGLLSPVCAKKAVKKEPAWHIHEEARVGRSTGSVASPAFGSMSHHVYTADLSFLPLTNWPGFRSAHKMAFTTPGSEETPDTSSSKTHLFDSGWSINIDIMLEQRPNTTNGTLL